MTLTINGRELTEQDRKTLLLSITNTNEMKTQGYVFTYEGEELSNEDIHESLENIAAAIFEKDEISLERR